MDCKENADGEGEQLLRPPTKGANYEDSDQAKNSINRLQEDFNQSYRAKGARKSKEYKERMEKASEKMVSEGKVLNWYNLSKLMTSEAANVAGRMPKRMESPWLEGHEKEAQEEHKRITEISSELFSLIETSKRCLTVEEKEQKILLINEKREERKKVGNHLERN